LILLLMSKAGTGTRGRDPVTGPIVAAGNTDLE